MSKAQALYAGVNLGGWISQYTKLDHEHFRGFITADDIRRIAGWGMDHVRLPVDYPVLEDDGKPFAYKQDGLAYVDRCIEWCEAEGLGVVLDLHRAAGFAFQEFARASLFTDATVQERFLALWEMFARRYRGLGRMLAFELLNEIVLPAGSEPWNRLATRAIERIRAVDPVRTIVVGGNFYNIPSELANLDLPADPHLVYTFHYYFPMLFTHQNAPWVPALTQYAPRVDYPGDAPGLEAFVKQHPEVANFLAIQMGRRMDQDLLRLALQPAVEFAARTGHSLYCGEYGAIDCAPMESRINWYRDFVGLLDEYHFGRAAWSYKAMDFGLVDRHGRVVNEELVKIVSGRG